MFAKNLFAVIAITLSLFLNPTFVKADDPPLDVSVQFLGPQTIAGQGSYTIVVHNNSAIQASGVITISRPPNLYGWSSGVAEVWTACSAWGEWVPDSVNCNYVVQPGQEMTFHLNLRAPEYDTEACYAAWLYWSYFFGHGDGSTSDADASNNGNQICVQVRHQKQYFPLISR